MKTIDVKGAVVDDDTAAFYSFFGMSSVSPSAVSQVLNDGDDDDVQVNIASNGGDVFAASEIFTMLKSSSATVTVNIQGLAASAASVIAMAGDKVNISPTAQIMIHQAAVTAGGNKDDLAHEATVLDGIDQSIALAYAQKTGMSEDELLNMMAQETWLTATDAVDKGFADEIMFVEDNQLAFANDVGAIVPKSAVNKLLNLISKSERPVNKQQNKITESHLASNLKQSKVAILMNKNKETK